MHIVHKIDNILTSIFPNINIQDACSIISVLEHYYTYNGVKPKVSIEREFVFITVNTNKIINQEKDFNKVLSLSEKGNYSEAKRVLIKLIKNDSTNSEYYRILGQIQSEEGNQDEAINSLIDALRWDSKNAWALLMMGNIFSKYKNDISTAMKYYDQALIAKPNDNITINNIAANLLQQGKIEESEKYFLSAKKINDKYPNTFLGLGMVSVAKQDYKTAFENFLLAIKYNDKKDNVLENSIRHAIESAKRMISDIDGSKIYKQYLHTLELKGITKIDIIEDNSISTVAKIEFAENYNREKHLVKYKPNSIAYEHLIMHELVHLEFVIDARNNNSNQLFTSNQENTGIFVKEIQPNIIKLRNIGVSDSNIRQFTDGLLSGINSQIFNTPIDLFIEDYLYKNYPDLRPFQFLSLYSIINQGIIAVTDKKVLEVTPKNIVSKSKIYNLVIAIQYKELYNLDFTKEFNATSTEIKQAFEFYNEFLQYKDDKKPAEEYELLLNWAEDLQVDKYFELINENDYRNRRTNIDSLLSSIESDPYDTNSNDIYKNREIEKFEQSAKQSDINMPIVMFMVSALEFFKNNSKEEVKKIAFEIAMLGTQGINPNKSGYKLNSISNKDFSGNQILAYYYVSWALAIPEMLTQLGLPYDKEYNLAKTLAKN